MYYLEDKPTILEVNLLPCSAAFAHIIAMLTPPYNATKFGGNFKEAEILSSVFRKSFLFEKAKL
jgi:hypothetical protein